jgi:plastocyanin
VLKLAAVATVGSLAGCGSQASQGETPAPTTSEPTTEAPTTDAPTTAEPTATSTPNESSADVVEVRMITDGNGPYFDPKGLLVESGTTIRFVNDSGNHATAAYHPDTGGPLRIPEAATPWESELFDEAGATYDVTLETPGVYDFNCPPHESMGMVGRLIVDESKGGPGTTEPGDVSPAAWDEFPTVERIIDEEVVAGP